MKTLTIIFIYVLSLFKSLIFLGIMLLGLVSMIYFNYYPDEFTPSIGLIWLLRIMSIIVVAIIIYNIINGYSFSSYSSIRKVAVVCGISLVVYQILMSIFLLASDGISYYFGQYEYQIYANVEKIKYDDGIFNILYQPYLGEESTISLKNDLVNSLKNNDTIIINVKESFFGKNITYLKSSHLMIHFNPYNFITNDYMYIIEELLN